MGAPWRSRSTRGILGQRQIGGEESAVSPLRVCAAELTGQARVVGIRRWVGIMQSLSSLQEQAPLYVSQPLSPLGSPGGGAEGDWQTLTQVGVPLPQDWGFCLLHDQTSALE